MVNKDRLAYTVYISSLSIDLYLDLDIGRDNRKEAGAFLVNFW